MGCAPSKPEILVQAKSQSRPQQNPPAPSKAQGVIDANDSQGVSVLLTLSDGKEGGDVLTLPASSDADSSSGIDLHVRLLSSSGKEGDPPDYIAKGLQALITTDALALEAIVLRAKALQKLHNSPAHSNCADLGRRLVLDLGPSAGSTAQHNLEPTAPFVGGTLALSLVAQQQGGTPYAILLAHTLQQDARDINNMQTMQRPFPTKDVMSQSSAAMVHLSDPPLLPDPPDSGTLTVTNLLAGSVQRANVLLGEVSALMTLITLQSAVVLAQNPASMEYYGPLEGQAIVKHCSGKSNGAERSQRYHDMKDLGESGGLLASLFIYAGQAMLQEMLEVPSSLSWFLDIAEASTLSDLAGMSHTLSSSVMHSSTRVTRNMAHSGSGVGASATRGSSQTPFAVRTDASLSGGNGSATGGPKPMGILKSAREGQGGGFDAYGATSRPGSFLVDVAGPARGNARDLHAVRAVASAVAAAVQSMAMPGDGGRVRHSQSGQVSSMVVGGAGGKSGVGSAAQVPAVSLSTVPEHKSDSVQLSVSIDTGPNLAPTTADGTQSVAVNNAAKGMSELVHAADTATCGAPSKPAEPGAPNLEENHIDLTSLSIGASDATKLDNGHVEDGSIPVRRSSSQRPTPRLLTRVAGSVMGSLASDATPHTLPPSSGSYGIRPPLRTASKMGSGVVPDGLLPPAASSRAQTGSSEWAGGTFSVAQAQAGPRLQALLKQVSAVPPAHSPGSMQGGPPQQQQQQQQPGGRALSPTVSLSGQEQGLNSASEATHTGQGPASRRIPRRDSVQMMLAVAQEASGTTANPSSIGPPSHGWNQGHSSLTGATAFWGTPTTPQLRHAGASNNPQSGDMLGDRPSLKIQASDPGHPPGKDPASGTHRPHTMGRQSSGSSSKGLQHIVEAGQQQEQQQDRTSTGSGRGVAPMQRVLSAGTSRKGGNQDGRLPGSGQTGSEMLPLATPFGGGLYSGAVAGDGQGGRAESDDDSCSSDAEEETLEEAEQVEGGISSPGLPWRWHELEAKPLVDPVSQELSLLLVQRDVTERAQLEAQLSQLTEAQLTMLSQVFPRHVIEALSRGGEMTMEKIAGLARTHPNATILFMDIVGFTAMSKDVPAEDVILFLHLLFSRFDMLLDVHQVQKIDTIGDAYLAGVGILLPDDQGFKSVDEGHDVTEGAARVVEFGMAMMRAAMPVRMPNGQPVKLRIGIHTGDCVSGIVGLGVPKWSCFGDTVNTAARLEQTCEMCHIQISEDTYRLLPPELRVFNPTQGVHMKGRGTFQTYIWAAPPEWAAGEGLGMGPALDIGAAGTQPDPAHLLPGAFTDSDSLDEEVATHTGVPNVVSRRAEQAAGDAAVPQALEVPSPGHSKVPRVVRHLTASKNPVLGAVAESQPSSAGSFPAASSRRASGTTAAAAAPAGEDSPRSGSQESSVRSALRRPTLAPLLLDQSAASSQNGTSPGAYADMGTSPQGGQQCGTAAHAAGPSPRGTAASRPSSAGVPSALSVLASAALPSPHGQASAQPSPTRGAVITSPASDTSRPGSQVVQDSRWATHAAAASIESQQGQVAAAAGSPRFGARQALVLPNTHPLAGPASPASRTAAAGGTGTNPGSSMLASLAAQTPVGSWLQQAPAAEQSATQATPSSSAATSDALASTKQLGGSGRIRLISDQPGGVLWGRQGSLRGRGASNADALTPEAYAGVSGAAFSLVHAGQSPPPHGVPSMEAVTNMMLAMRRPATIALDNFPTRGLPTAPAAPATQRALQLQDHQHGAVQAWADTEGAPDEGKQAAGQARIRSPRTGGGSTPAPVRPATMGDKPQAGAGHDGSHSHQAPTSSTLVAALNKAFLEKGPGTLPDARAHHHPHQSTAGNRSTGLSSYGRYVQSMHPLLLPVVQQVVNHHPPSPFAGVTLTTKGELRVSGTGGSNQQLPELRSSKSYTSATVVTRDRNSMTASTAGPDGAPTVTRPASVIRAVQGSTGHSFTQPQGPSRPPSMTVASMRPPSYLSAAERDPAVGVTPSKAKHLATLALLQQSLAVSAPPGSVHVLEPSMAPSAIPAPLLGLQAGPDVSLLTSGNLGQLASMWNAAHALQTSPTAHTEASHSAHHEEVA